MCYRKGWEAQLGDCVAAEMDFSSWRGSLLRSGIGAGAAEERVWRL